MFFPLSILVFLSMFSLVLLCIFSPWSSPEYVLPIFFPMSFPLFTPFGFCSIFPLISPLYYSLRSVFLIYILLFTIFPFHFGSFLFLLFFPIWISLSCPVLPLILSVLPPQAMRQSLKPNAAQVSPGDACSATWDMGWAQNYGTSDPQFNDHVKSRKNIQLLGVDNFVP